MYIKTALNLKFSSICGNSGPFGFFPFFVFNGLHCSYYLKHLQRMARYWRLHRILEYEVFSMGPLTVTLSGYASRSHNMPTILQGYTCFTVPWQNSHACTHHPLIAHSIVVPLCAPTLSTRAELRDHQVLPGRYEGSRSCDLNITQNRIRIEGVADLKGAHPHINCGSDGQFRFALVTGQNVEISNLHIGNCTVTDGSYLLDGLFGAGIVAHGPNSSVVASNVVFQGCKNGVIHASQGGRVELVRSKLMNNLGTAAIATYSSTLVLEGTEIMGATDLTPSAQNMWLSLCATQNGTCTAPLPAYTLCEEVGMNATGAFSTPYYGGYVTKCEGSTRDRCVVRQELDTPMAINGLSAFRAPGGDFGGTCSGYCAAFGLECFFAWPSRQKTCHVQTNLLATSRGCATQVTSGGGNNENVCVCVRKDSPSAQFGAGVATMLQSTSRLSNSSVTQCWSDSVQVRSRSSSTMHEVLLSRGRGRGVSIDRGTRANVTHSTVQGHTGIGIDVTGELYAQGTSVVSNIGAGIVVSGGATATIVDSKTSSNGAFGVSVISRARVSMDACTVSNNAQGGVSVQGNAQLRLDRSRVSSNTGRGVTVNNATVTAYNTLVNGNNAGPRTSGGGWSVLEQARTEIVGGEVSGNTAGADGGGIYWDATNGASLKLRGGLRVRGNEAYGWGGGMRVENVYPMVRTNFKTPQRFNGLVTNGTHMFVHSKNNVYHAYNLATGKLQVVAGSGSLGAKDGTMEGGDPSLFPTFNLGGGTFTLDNALQNIYVAEAGTHLLRRIRIRDGNTTSIAGKYYTQLGKPLTSARDNPGIFFGPWGVVSSKDDSTLYVSDGVGYLAATGFGGVIYSVSTTTYELEIIAGGNAYGHKDGPSDEAQFMTPWSLALDTEADKLYVADVFDRTVRVVHLKERIVTTLAGLPGVAAYADGAVNRGTFVYKFALVLSADRTKLYVAEDFRIRQVRAMCLYIHTYIHISAHSLCCLECMCVCVYACAMMLAHECSFLPGVYAHTRA